MAVTGDPHQSPKMKSDSSFDFFVHSPIWGVYSHNHELLLDRSSMEPRIVLVAGYSRRDVPCSEGGTRLLLDSPDEEQYRKIYMLLSSVSQSE